MKLALFGYGGHARELAHQIDQKVDFFVDDDYANETAKAISKFDPEEYKIMIAVGDSQIRKVIVDKLPKETKYFTYIHPSAHIMDDNIEVGDGSFIGANCILTTNIKIGKQAILNRGNHISHDCIIGDFFSAMPNSIVSGNIKIGDRVYLGANSCVREKINICDDVVIGMNAGVVKNIHEKGIYIGTPAQKLLK